MVKIGRNVFIADTAVIIGDVTIGDNVTIMDSCVIRGDQNSIIIGDNTNIQDNATVHTSLRDKTIIGRNVSIGHNAIVHGSTVDDLVLVGMGAILMNGSHIRSGSVIAAGAVVTEGFESPENALVAGLPARVIKTDEKYRKMAEENSREYLILNKRHLNHEFDVVKGKTCRD
ncbi:gamma carbonic anhydrase family protein [Picrophilus oshimae]|uniref:Carbonic anhydrase or acetyltransferase, isoleucine patch superfamily n=1 Tax=Picrophilus torridus (strain ATCC 700027 / DSM 9790 / JCM 10055 / NBRC 100828 / KAW 2/3) TaxID=1122961 RepID=Q6L175_PICTO|nr:gamma carbonic anhydrase family protein [Picrophilus oshimae]AAT43277.1 ferripyochelin binding protein [Picrophilus oshimae DSM 9789]SMD30416.1 Carbonic anhydrase or acetyltransferase, isoleucine patch superfamily [Picrophilus oshimae DSM 9789]